MQEMYFYSSNLGTEVHATWAVLLRVLVETHSLGLEESCICNERPLLVRDVAARLEKMAVNYAQIQFPARKTGRSVPSILLGAAEGDAFARNLIPGEVMTDGAIRDVGWAMASLEHMMYGRCVDERFEACQNLARPDMYNYWGLSTKGLRLVDGGVTFKTLVDVSANVGRTVKYNGEYEEGLGHLMWLRPTFWEKTGMPEVVPTPLAHYEKRGDVAFCVLRENPFTMEDPGAEILNAIRPQLFRKRRDGRIGALNLGHIKPLR